MRRVLAAALLVAVCALAAGPAPARADGDDLPVRLYDDLAPVRTNLEALARPVCIFVGAFPRDQREDWARDLCREGLVRVLAHEVTFVRHRRQAVRDLQEHFLRERGLPRRQSWEGAVVVDARGEGVACLEAPVNPERLARLLQQAKARHPDLSPNTGAFRHPDAPAYRIALDQRFTLSDLEPPEWHVEFRVPGRDVRVRVRSLSVGPPGPRGERMVFDEVSVLRFVRNRLGEAVEERRTDHPQGPAVLWSYRLKSAEEGHVARAEVLFGQGGDLFVIRVESPSLAPGELAPLAEQALSRLSVDAAKP